MTYFPLSFFFPPFPYIHLFSFLNSLSVIWWQVYATFMITSFCFFFQGQQHSLRILQVMYRRKYSDFLIYCHKLFKWKTSMKTMKCLLFVTLFPTIVWDDYSCWPTYLIQQNEAWYYSLLMIFLVWTMLKEMMVAWEYF